MGTSPRSLLVMLVAAGAGFAGFSAFRLLRPPAPAALPAAASPAVQPQAAPQAPEAAQPAPIPAELPDFELADRQGVRRRLSYWRDQPLMVNFWATWCAPCRREIPLLRQLRAGHRAQHLEVVGIAVDFRDAVLEYARRIGLDYPLLIGEQDGLDAAAALGVDAVFPFTVFTDRGHRIIAVKVGELHADEAGFILDRIGEIDAGRLDPQSARAQITDRLRELAVARAQRGENPGFEPPTTPKSPGTGAN